MNTSDKISILSNLCTRDEAGRHFTELYDASDLDDLEGEGLIKIQRPVHDTTGIRYSQEYWSVEVSEDGIALCG